VSIGAALWPCALKWAVASHLHLLQRKQVTVASKQLSYHHSSTVRPG
jgi:hypothetical protein